MKGNFYILPKSIIEDNNNNEIHDFFNTTHDIRNTNIL